MSKKCLKSISKCLNKIIIIKTKTMSNTEKFYQWMKRINNIYLNDNGRMTRAFHIVANN